MNKLFLIFHGKFPSEKAASLFAAKSCESFSDLGLDVTLIVPKRRSNFKKSFSNFYNIKNNFNVVFLPTLDFFGIPVIKYFAFYISLLSFSLSSFIYLFFSAKRDHIVYSNETLPLLLTSVVFPKTFFEVHDYPENKSFFYQILFKRVKWVLATNKWKAVKLQKKFNINNKKIICEPNAVEIKYFNINITRKKAREKLNLPLDKKIIVYTGHLYSWKGVDTLVEATKLLNKNILVYLVGGTKKDIEKYKKKIKYLENIKLVGFRPHSEIPYWQKSANALVLPNTAKENISKYYTSPMKLFEYMASKIPIIASDIPSISEILNDNNAIMFESDNPKNLSEKIIWVFKNRDEGNKIAKNAFIDAEKYTWKNRAKRIINFINK